MAANQAEINTFYSDVRAAVKKHSGEELDIKPFEADMRRLFNTYIQADPADTIGEIDQLPLMDLIVKSGINDAISRRLNEKGKLSNHAVAEAIINNVRKTIIRDQLTDPRFYAQMSALLEDLIKQARADAKSYAEFLRKAEELAKKLATKGFGEDVPEALRSSKLAVVVYNNLMSVVSEEECVALASSQGASDQTDSKVFLAMQIDRTVLEHAPADWKGDPVKESQLGEKLFVLLGRNRVATEKLLDLLKNTPGS